MGVILSLVKYWAGFQNEVSLLQTRRRTLSGFWDFKPAVSGTVRDQVGLFFSHFLSVFLKFFIIVQANKSYCKYTKTRILWDRFTGSWVVQRALHRRVCWSVKYFCCLSFVRLFYVIIVFTALNSHSVCRSALVKLSACSLIGFSEVLCSGSPADKLTKLIDKHLVNSKRTIVFHHSTG